MKKVKKVSHLILTFLKIIPAKKILELSPLVRYNDIDYCGCTSNPNMSVKQAGDKNE